MLLSTPDVEFFYDVSTGQELANNMQKYRVSSRAELPSRWSGILHADSEYLTKKGLKRLTLEQDNFALQLAGVFS